MSHRFVHMYTFVYIIIFENISTCCCQVLLCFSTAHFSDSNLPNCIFYSGFLSPQLSKIYLCFLSQKRKYRIMDTLVVIERGCSKNCNGRPYIWTDEYQVFCCDDDNQCNSADKQTLHLGIISFVSVITVIVRNWL